MRRPTLYWLAPLLVLLIALATAAFAQDESAAEKIGDTATADNAPAGKTGGGSTDTGEQISIGKIVQWGGKIGYFIIFLSVLTLMLVGFHLMLLRRKRFCPPSLQDKVAALIRERKMKEAAEMVRSDNSLLGRIISSGLSRVRGGYEEMEEIMNDVAEDDAMRLEQGVGYFSLIAAIAPLCGLLGTVIGMILAFNAIANKGVVNPGDLADPIQQALVTTCFGLIVAIPNVVAFTFFRNRLHVLLADTAIVVEDLMLPFRKLKPTPAKAATKAEKPYDAEHFPRPGDEKASASAGPEEPSESTEAEETPAPEEQKE